MDESQEKIESTPEETNIDETDAETAEVLDTDQQEETLIQEELNTGEEAFSDEEPPPDMPVDDAEAVLDDAQSGSEDIGSELSDDALGGDSDESTSGDIESEGLETDEIKPADIDFILNLPLELTVEYGRARKKVASLLELQKGNVIELSKLKGEPVDILANNKLIAKGEVVVEDDKYAIRITEIISRLERIKKL